MFLCLRVVLCPAGELRMVDGTGASHEISFNPPFPDLKAAQPVHNT